MLRLDTLRQQIAQKKVLPCYLFFGEEEHQKNLAVRTIAKLFLGADQSGPGPEIVYGSEIDGAEIVNRAQSLGMFSQRTVLVVREADALSVKSRAAIAGYLAGPNPDACLILCTVKPDAKMALVKQFDELAAVVNFKALTEREAADWALKEAAGRKLRLTADAAQLLVRLAGTDLGVINRELDKLALLPGPQAAGEIGTGAIRSLAGLNLTYGDYELTTAVSFGQRREALAIFQTMLLSGEDPARILSSIGYELMKLWKVASVPGDAAAVARRTGIHEYAVRQLLPAARRRSGDEYSAAICRVYRAELRLKSGRGEPAALVQDLIYNLTT
jgi:DNA polymerase-3 subunit delta